MLQKGQYQLLVIIKSTAELQKISTDADPFASPPGHPACNFAAQEHLGSEPLGDLHYTLDQHLEDAPSPALDHQTYEAILCLS